jgi:hypothetical protein
MSGTLGESVVKLVYPVIKRCGKRLNSVRKLEEKRLLGRLDVDGRMILKWAERNRILGFGLDSSGS